MPSFSGRPATRFFCALALAATGSAPVSAQQRVLPDAEAVDLDQSVQALKDEVLQLARDAQLADLELAYPDSTRVTLSFSNQFPGLLLQRVSLKLDGGTPVVHEYDERQRLALAGNVASDRLIRLNLPRGTHRVEADFVGRVIGADDDEPPVTARHEASFDKGLDPLDIELRITRAERRGTAIIEMREWRPE